MKIKLIDLLNKIANDEEVPEKIMYDRCLYTCDKITRTYYDEENNTLWESYNFRILTDEVEIIEEPKKIEKLEPVRGSDLADLTSKNVALKNNSLIELCKTLKNMNNKINELIDEINNLKRE